MRTLLLTSVLLSACSNDPVGRSTLPSGGFHYTAMSPAGTPVLTGRIRLAFPDDSTITGTWTIAWLPGADTTTPVGPQVGTGDLFGSRSGDALWIQLNPHNADHNVGLRALATTAGYTGEWEWVTFTGPHSRGSFAARAE